MNKLLCLALALFYFAQICPAQSYFGIEAGGLISNTPGNASGGPNNVLSQKKNILGSLQGGVWSDMRISDYMDFQPHLLLTRKGSTLENAYETGGSGRLSLTYLELPLNLMYRIPLGYDDLFLGGGVYGAVAVGGHFKDSPDSAGGTFSGQILFDGNATPPNSRDLHLSRFDGGLNAQITYQCSFGLTFHLRYSLGMIDINPGGPGWLRNQSAVFSLAYLFHYNTRD